MMKMTALSHLFKWENLHNWWLTKYFFAPLYIYILYFLFTMLSYLIFLGNEQRHNTVLKVLYMFV